MGIIDLDSHLRENWFLDEIYKFEGPFAEFTPRRIGDGQTHEARFEHNLGSEQRAPRATASRGSSRTHAIFHDPKANVVYGGGDIWKWQQGGYDMEARARDVMREDIGVQLIFPTGIEIPTMTPGPLGVEAARAYNNWVHRLVSGYREQFLPVAMLPARSPEAMAGELRRCVTELGFKAAHLVCYTPETTLDDPAYDSFYEAAQELDVPLFCHPPTGGELTNRGRTYAVQHVLGRPLNCVMALTSLVLGGVFERFPKLRVVFFECTAEFLVYWMHRMDDEWPIVRDDELAPQISTWPSEYVRQNCFASCEADEKMLATALSELGETQIVMATDYPHFDSTYPNTVRGLRERPDLTERQKRLILEENALRIVKL